MAVESAPAAIFWLLGESGKNDPMSPSDDKPGPEQPTEDETKRKFREALAAKQGRKGEDHIDSAAQQAQSHGPVETKRNFRRKTG